MPKSYFSYLILFLFSIQFIACSNDKSKMPIEESKMLNILTDMHLMEAYLDVEPISIKDSMARIYSAQIFKKHGITQPDFDSSLTYLYLHPIKYDSLYAQIERGFMKTKSKKIGKDSLHLATPRLDTNRR
jgi:hypothetical protein